MQYETVLKVLEEIDADDTKRIIVLNKTDMLDENSAEAFRLNWEFSDAIKISALNHQGFNQLTTAICDSLLGKVRRLVIPVENSDLIKDLRKNGTIIDEQWLDDGIHLKARIGSTTKTGEEALAAKRILALLQNYLIE